MSNPERNAFNPQEFANKPSDQTRLPVAFNVIHVDDISKSKIAKLEEWMKYKDPNEVGVDRLNRSGAGTNQHIIREIDVSDNDNARLMETTSLFDSSVYKLTLRDNFDNYCFAYEYNDKLPFLRTGSTLPIPIKLGGKLIISSGATVANGALLVDRKVCKYIGVDESSELVKALNSNLVEKSINILQNPEL
ncbi:hypothetical protein PSN45_001038 [Yamadazyma tenuis]|uniref:RecQ mediated genome instability protein 1 OB-fold domain-containing protein n=1 Tax=Candida tenuis (strain ATCC 10573 / BCRC 21748 / CBS 615 / JCM 9827 / NBRC 10315 / NRRL Y-1498 / VKM Y-70) TaxID=590646 RepID=G3B7S8_CANTC|nr:uncharacterized protein CANTEDRAFT_108251 [Yamadazyma tenuis ATCC 10573]EGV62312.1 hypothetical protein CANTEDRAFT_108251 [Yamadazyma tenuis ATCC 10573]WEJ93570.1 hypothetical protein PSN45_001038 [Yamadazyma tenuis]